ncbi:MAG: glycosyltransferase family 2 protein [Bellilinea sp.]|jgi:GT2 family glycosyltransferase
MNNETIHVSILIVSYNVRGYLEKCLDSIFQQVHACRVEVIVVDNLSTDGSAESVAARFPQVRLIRSQSNLGFAGGNKIGFPITKGRYILLLNPDTIVEPGGVDALVNFLDAHPCSAAAGSLLLNPDGSLQPSCFPFPTPLREMWRLLHLDKLIPVALYPQHNWDSSKPHRVDVLQGTSLALRRKAIEQTGFLDDTFFMYSEEVDLCYRLHLAGWQLHWVPASKVIHFGGQSTRQSAQTMFLQLYRAKTQYFRKHHGPFMVFVYKIILILASMLRLAASPFFFILFPKKRQEHSTTILNYTQLLRNILSF